MARQTILISHDPELAIAVAAALPDGDRLTVLDTADDQAALDLPSIAVVILDLPAASRSATYQRLRTHYTGQVIVLVDSDEPAAAWPADPALQVVARPIRAADLTATLPPPSLPQRASVARRQLRQDPQATGRLMPLTPGTVFRPARAGTPRTGATTPGASLSDPSIPERDKLANRPSPATAGRRSRPVRRVRAELAAGLLLLVAGIVLGANLGGQNRVPASPVAPPTSTAAPTSIVVRRTPPPPSCMAALEGADVIIAYLVSNTRNLGLVRSLEQYRTDSRACRRAR